MSNVNAILRRHNSIMSYESNKDLRQDQCSIEPLTVQKLKTAPKIPYLLLDTIIAGKILLNTAKVSKNAWSEIERRKCPFEYCVVKPKGKYLDCSDIHCCWYE